MNSEYGYTSLDAIVRSQIADEGHIFLHKYLRYLRYIIEGLMEWNISGGARVKTVKLLLSNTKSAALPLDYMGWSKVGVKRGDRLQALSSDQSLTFHFETESAVEVPNTSYANSQSGLWFEYDVNGQSTLRRTQGGRGHSGFGYFRINEEEKKIQCSSDVFDEYIYLEYVASVFAPAPSMMVNTYCSKMLKDYCFWKEARRRFGDSSGETRARLQEYLASYHENKGRASDLNLEGLLDAARHQYHTAPKL